jgi:hypothetical protein
MQGSDISGVCNACFCGAGLMPLWRSFIPQQQVQQLPMTSVFAVPGSRDLVLPGMFRAKESGKWHQAFRPTIPVG